MKLYVGNLSFEVTEDDLREVFKEYGDIESIHIIKDRYSGQSKGFGFVEMPDKSDAMAAIEGLNDTELKGRKLNVNKARPRSDNRGGGGGGGRGGGGRGGGGRGGGGGGYRY